jgi:hypothetical protein
MAKNWQDCIEHLCITNLNLTNCTFYHYIRIRLRCHASFTYTYCEVSHILFPPEDDRLMTAMCHDSINKKRLGSFTFLTSCNEFVEMPMEAPFNGLHAEVERCPPCECYGYRQMAVSCFSCFRVGKQ